MATKPPTRDERASWLDLLGDRAAHDRIAAGLECLREAEVEQPPVGEPAAGWLRVAAWNIERGVRPDEIAARLGSTGAHVALLSEVDRGMARTGNRDVLRDLAVQLRAGYAFGVEFIELGLGDAAEAARLEGLDNDLGLHGNAVLSRVPIRDVRVLRLDPGGDWFVADRGQPRIGGRVAVAVTIELDGVAIRVVSVHLESASTARERAVQMAALLDAVGPGPAVVGGDLNTFGAPIDLLADRAAASLLRTTEPARLSWPADHEPLFDAAWSHGFEWVDANVAAPTTRHGPDGRPDHPPVKLDWILVRRLEARRPTVVAATGTDGAALSDHELLAVSVRLPRS